MVRSPWSTGLTGPAFRQRVLDNSQLTTDYGPRTSDSTQEGQVLRRKARGPARGIDQHVKRLTNGNGRLVRTCDLVAEPESSSREFRDPCANEQFVFVSSRVPVPAARFGDDQEQAGLAFHVAVRETAVIAVLTPAHFEPNEVIRVVGHSHLVGLGITHLHARLGDLTGNGVFLFVSLHLMNAFVARRKNASAHRTGDCSGLMMNTQGGVKSDVGLKSLPACASSLLGYKLISVEARASHHSQPSIIFGSDEQVDLSDCTRRAIRVRRRLIRAPHHRTIPSFIKRRPIP